MRTGLLDGGTAGAVRREANKEVPGKAIAEKTAEKERETTRAAKDTTVAREKADEDHDPQTQERPGRADKGAPISNNGAAWANGGAVAQAGR